MADESADPHPKEEIVEEIIHPEANHHRLADLVYRTVENDLAQTNAQISMKAQLLQHGRGGPEALEEIVELAQQNSENTVKLGSIVEAAKNGRPIKVIKRPIGDFLDLSD